MSKITLAMIFGDGYKNENIQPFVNFLESHNISTIGIPLLEESEDVSYNDINPNNYCKYIDKFIPRFCNNLYLYGISKGCEWLTIYASKRKNIKKLILVEPTTFPGKPDFLVDYEIDRGNDYIEDLYETSDVEMNQDKTNMALDSIVSRRNKYFPKCPINIIWTSRNNQNEPYSAKVLDLKDKYVKYLKNNGCKVKVSNINSDHCVDLHEKYFPYLLKIITQ